VSRPTVSFVAWNRVDARSAEIARSLGGEARCFYDHRLTKPWLVPIRYALSSVSTVAYLLARRPRRVIVTLPPTPVGLIAYAYAALVRAPLVLDSHPAAFGRKDKRVWKALMPVHGWLARRARGTVVTTNELADEVRRLGGRAALLHEAPTEWPAASSRSLPARPRVLFVNVFGTDDPVAPVIESAADVPEVDLLITGRIDLCPPSLRHRAPDNVHFVGYLDNEQYRAAIVDADVVLVLTTERTSVMRAAYEAVYAHRPLVVSDWPALREFFPDAIHVENTADDIARGLQEAVQRHDELAARAPAAAARQLERWQQQSSMLRGLLDLEPPPVERTRAESSPPWGSAS
jgi:glycosyltransferase involved in cell wall biosynthesis